MNGNSTRAFLLIRALAGLALTAPAAAMATDAAPFDVAAHYEKSEHRVAMRDGTKLFTIVYTPRDKSRRYPLLLRRTPYSIAPYGAGRMHSVADLVPSEAFLRDGYIIAMQDARGRYKSEGDWVDFRPLRTDPRGVDETTDTFDSIEWLVKNIGGNNGRVGL